MWGSHQSGQRRKGGEAHIATASAMVPIPYLLLHRVVPPPGPSVGKNLTSYAVNT